MSNGRVRVVLPYGNQYLLERMNNAKYPENLGKRRFPGGGIESGETPQQAALRELKEELGLTVKEDDFETLGTYAHGQHGSEVYLRLPKHDLSPGNYNATVGGDKVIELLAGDASGDDYWGADLSQFNSASGKQSSFQSQMSMSNPLLDAAIRRLQKEAMAPVESIAPSQAPPAPAPPMPAGGAAPPMPGAPPGAPVDPAMAGGAPPVDPATGMPMDPAMMDPAMMDPVMMDPAAAGMPMEDPVTEILELLKQIKQEVTQTRTIVAYISDTAGIKPPLNDLLAANEDTTKSKPSSGGAKESWDLIPNEQDGDAAVIPRNSGVMTFDIPTEAKFSAAARILSGHLSRAKS